MTSLFRELVCSISSFYIKHPILYKALGASYRLAGGRSDRYSFSTYYDGKCAINRKKRVNNKRKGKCVSGGRKTACFKVGG